MALNQVPAELAECGRLRAPFRDATHILLLDLDLDRPGKKGAILSGLGLDSGSSKKRNRDLRNDHCSEQCGVMTIAQNCRRGPHTSVRVKGGALPNRQSRASVPVTGDSPSARSRDALGRERVSPRAYNPTGSGWRRALEAWGDQATPPNWILGAIGMGPHLGLGGSGKFGGCQLGANSSSVDIVRPPVKAAFMFERIALHICMSGVGSVTSIS